MGALTMILVREAGEPGPRDWGGCHAPAGTLLQGANVTLPGSFWAFSWDSASYCIKRRTRESRPKPVDRLVPWTHRRCPERAGLSDAA